MLKSTPNERSLTDGGIAAEIYEIYAYMSAGTFELHEVSGKTLTKLGGTLKETLNDPDGSGEIPRNVDIKYYTPAPNGTITIATAGFYHIVYSPTANVIVVTEAIWGLRGSSTPNGWGFTPFNGTGNKDVFTFTLANVQMMSGDFKFAYSSGWKIGLNNTDADNATIRVNTNLGPGANNTGTLTFNGNVGTFANLSPGGMGNFALNADTRGVYTFEFKWTKGSGFTATMTKTGDVTIQYPEELFAIGSFCDWDWGSDNVIAMTPVHSNPHAFWTMVYFEAGTEFKFAPQKAWESDFGVTGGATAGVYARGGNNISIATDGYYMIFVDLKEEKIFVGEPKVYLVGPTAQGEWTDIGSNPANLFTVDATDGITHTTFGAGELRMFATCTLADGIDWWQMEFIILDGKIEYRGAGGDQQRVTVGASKLITLKPGFNGGVGIIQP
jgi:hypothetical protein